MLSNVTKKMWWESDGMRLWLAMEKPVTCS